MGLVTFAFRWALPKWAAQLTPPPFPDRQRGKSEAEAQACVLAHFTKADRDRDSRLSYEEFEVFYALVRKGSGFQACPGSFVHMWGLGHVVRN